MDDSLAKLVDSVIQGAIVGPTGVGKTDLAFFIAQTLGNVEIISCDAMAVYKLMNIGTAKSTRAGILINMVDLVYPWDEFNVYLYKEEALKVLRAIEAKSNKAILVGGTGLYFRALVDDIKFPPQFLKIRKALYDEASSGRETQSFYEELKRLDPEAAELIDGNNLRRIIRALEVIKGSGRLFSDFNRGLKDYRPLNFNVVGLKLDQELLSKRILTRLYEQIEAGFVNEVKNILSFGRPLSATAIRAHGYKEIISYLEGQMTLDEAISQTYKQIVNYTKRQMRWFRRDPRIIWVDCSEGFDPAVIGEKYFKVSHG